jgi:hypothetical protein
MKRLVAAFFMILVGFHNQVRAWEVGPFKGDDPKLPNSGEILPDPGDVISVLTFPVRIYTEVGGALLGQAATNVDVLVRNLGNEAQTAIRNAINTQDKAISDATQNLVKSANDIVDAAHATARYAEREVSSYQDVLSNAEKRVREGKVADAIWHVSTDSWQATNKNAAQLASENQIIAAAGQAVATAYGGPAGARPHMRPG